jgi:hypothetical protein
MIDSRHASMPEHQVEKAWHDKKGMAEIPNIQIPPNKGIARDAIDVQSPELPISTGVKAVAIFPCVVTNRFL